MKKLNELVTCDLDIPILGVATDSRNVKHGYLFIATKGFYVDHFEFIEDAIQRGAVAVVATRGGDFSVPIIVVSNIDYELISICEKFYDVRSEEFSFIGITGTDGKTTTAIITRNLLNKYFPTAYIGTNGLYCGEDIYSISNTTPCVEELYHLFSVAKKYKCKVIVMEVSSEAMLHHRVDSILFDAIGYTNITEDHLNVHETIENYRKCKFRLSSLLKDGAVVFSNGDDESCQLLTVNCKINFGVNPSNDCVISDIKECKDGVLFTVIYNHNTYLFSSRFFGLYNVYNVVLAWLLSSRFGISLERLCKDVSTLPQVLGRREIFHDVRGFDILLDYAHTENAISNLLQSLSSYRNVIVVTGAAGGREKEKRPRIGDLLFHYSDFIVFTMDDPRYEDPKEIVDDLIGNHQEKNYVFIANRQEAISYSIAKAKKGDVVAIIGKGRDNYMAIYDRREPYCDYDVIMKFLHL